MYSKFLLFCYQLLYYSFAFFLLIRSSWRKGRQGKQAVLFLDSSFNLPCSFLECLLIAESKDFDAYFGSVLFLRPNRKIQYNWRTFATEMFSSFDVRIGEIESSGIRWAVLWLFSTYFYLTYLACLCRCRVILEKKDFQVRTDFQFTAGKYFW